MNKNIKKNFFLTGERGVGKSTALSTALKKAAVNTTGFLTLPYQIQGHPTGHYIHSLSDNILLQDNDKPINITYGMGDCIAIEESFELFGARYLQQAMKDSKIIVMDELGVLESNAKCFIQSVTACLDSSLQVVGVLKLCSAEWLANIKARQDTQVLTVTRQNRNSIPDMVVDFLT